VDVKWVRVVLHWSWRAIANSTWWLLGVWTVLAVFSARPRMAIVTFGPVMTPCGSGFSGRVTGNRLLGR
jgi:hypothetical protein